MIWRKVTANGYTWTIEFVRGLHKSGAEGEDRWGHVEPYERRILLDSELKNDHELLWHTLIHEMRHIVGWDEFETDKHDEDTLDRAAGHLAQLLQPFLKKPRFK